MPVKVLYGTRYDPPVTSGIYAANELMVKALDGRVDLHLLVSRNASRSRAPFLVEWGTHKRFSALCVTRNQRAIPRTAVPDDTHETRAFTRALSDALKAREIELVHMLDWEDGPGIAIFQAAIDAGIPFVWTPVDHRVSCAQVHLFEQGLRPCEGPDESFAKCTRCMATLRPPDDGPRARIFNVVRDACYRAGFTPPLKRYAPPEAWKRRAEAAQRMMAQAAAIVTWSEGFGRGLERRFDLPWEMFHTIYCPTAAGAKQVALDPARFEQPLRFGFMNGTGRHWGMRFLLEAWRRAAIPPQAGVLELFVYPGYGKIALQAGFGKLVRSGSVLVREERIAGREDEIYGRLAACVVSALWEFNGIDVGMLQRRMPVIAPFGQHQELFSEGVNGFFYERGNVESLASVLRGLALEPQRLLHAAGNCTIDPELTFDSFAHKHVALYRHVLERTSAARTP